MPLLASLTERDELRLRSEIESEVESLRSRRGDGAAAVAGAASRLASDDAVLLLLLLVQRGGTAAGAAAALLDAMHSAAELLLNDSGWERVPGKHWPREYRCAEKRADSTDVPTPSGAPPLFRLLLQLPLLSVPGTAKGGGDIWLATVVDRTGPCSLRSRDCVSVVDVIEHDADGRSTVMRHLVRGAWKGVRTGILDDAPPAEVDLGTRPGDGLETWAATTLACAGLMACERGRVCVFGLDDGGAVAGFLSRNSPVEVHAADPSAHVVQSVREYFGVGTRSEPAQRKVHAGGRRRQRTASAAVESLSAVADAGPWAAGSDCVLVRLPEAELGACLRQVRGVPVVAVRCDSRAAAAAAEEEMRGRGDPLRLVEYRVADDIRDENDDERADGGATRYEDGHSASNTDVSVLVWAPAGARAGDASMWLLALGYAEQAAAMPVAAAQRTQAVRVPSLLTDEEISSIHSAVDSVRDRIGVETRSPASPAWKVWFLQTGGVLDEVLPWLRKRVFDAAARVDEDAGWGLLKDRDQCRLRVAEYHEQAAPGPGIPDVHHIDQDSLVTIDVMLSDEGEFTGGELQTERPADPTFGKGDAMVFVSHKHHWVQPVTSGLRRVLVFEFWKGPERRCPHRCETVAGRCPRDRSGAGPPLPAAVLGGRCRLPFRLGVAHTDGDCEALLWQECEGDPVVEEPTSRVTQREAAPMAESDAALCDELF